MLPIKKKIDALKINDMECFSNMKLGKFENDLREGIKNKVFLK